MKRVVVTLIVLLTVVNANVKDDGKKLYIKENCQKCHLQDSSFDPNSIDKPGVQSKVKSKDDIHKWVASCDNYFGVGWFPEEQKSVEKYLNSVFYKFK